MKIFLSLLSVFLLTACSTPNSSSRPQTEETVAETQYFYWPSQGTAQVMYEILSYKSDAINVEMPQIVNLDEGHPLFDAINLGYDQAALVTRNEAEIFHSEIPTDEPSASLPWDHSVNWLGGRYHPALWSLAFQVYTYTGGAHPNHWTDTYNYHPVSNTLLELPDFFTSETYLPGLGKAVLEAVLVEKQTRWAESEQEGLYDPKEDSFLEDLTFDTKALSRWVVAEQNDVAGFMFFFPPYDIGAYAEGGYEVFVPKTVFEEWLKEEFKEVFE